MYYYYYFYQEPEILNLYLKYKYLTVSDTIRILRSLENLQKDILKSIGKFEFIDKQSGNILVFKLTISEVKTGNSIDIKVGKTWEVKGKGKDSNKRIVKELAINISVGLKEVVAFLLILGVFNSHNQNLNKLIDSDKEKIEVLKSNLSNNEIWLQLQKIQKDSLIEIESKANNLTKFLLQNKNITKVKIEDINLKDKNNNH